MSLAYDADPELTAEIARRVAAARRTVRTQLDEKPIRPAGMSYERALQIAVRALEDPRWDAIDPFEDLGYPYQVHRRAPRS